MAILKQIPKLNDPAWFAAWAYRIVRNKIADHGRRAGRQRRLVDALTERQPANDPPRDDPVIAVAEAMQRLPRD